MKQNKLISMVMTLVLVATMFLPVSGFAAGQTTIVVPAVSDTAGATVELPVRIENNPGIIGATLTVGYDEGLTLVGADNGEAFGALVMTKPGAFKSPCNFVWDAIELAEEDIKDGVILTLKFTIPEDALQGTKYNVVVTYESGDIIDNYLNPVGVSVTNGSIEVLDFIYGDLDSSRKFNTTDLIMMRRHIAGGYPQTIDVQAADVCLDTRINSTDVIILRRYLAGGYIDELPYRPNGCNHDMVEIPASEATYEEEGNIAYWCCKACGKLFKDSKGETAITIEETIVPKLVKSE